MRCQLLSRLLPITVFLALLALPAAAAASFDTLYGDYSHDLSIDGCRYSPAELRAGLGEIPADVRQYDPGFEAALSAALVQRSGGCDKAPVSPAAKPSNQTKLAADGSPGPRPPAPGAAVDTAPDKPLPGAVIAMIVVLAVLLAAAGLLLGAGYFGWDIARAIAPARIATRRASERIVDRIHSLRDRAGL